MNDRQKEGDKKSLFNGRNDREKENKKLFVDVDNRHKEWDKKSSFDGANDWEEENGKLFEDNGLIYKIVGGIAAFFVLLLIVGCCCLFKKKNHEQQIHTVLQKHEPVQPDHRSYAVVPQQQGYAPQKLKT